jgi:hypothetical protein
MGMKYFLLPLTSGQSILNYVQLQDPNSAECGCVSQLHADIFLILICWCVGILGSKKHWQINKIMMCPSASDDSSQQY